MVDSITWERLGSWGENAEFYPDKMSRAKIPGGWLVFAKDPIVENAIGLTFVPDPTHSWK